MTARVQHQVFPLKQRAARIALLSAILEGFSSPDEVRYNISIEAEPEPRRKPVVAWGRRYESVTAAAQWAQAQPGWARPRSLSGWRAWIRRQCDEDCWEGFYWSL